MKQGEFSVCQFFADDRYEYVRRYVDAEEAVKAARHYTTTVGARIGTTRRVIITDGGDCVNFEWKFGEGIVHGGPKMKVYVVMGNDFPDSVFRYEEAAERHVAERKKEDNRGSETGSSFPRVHWRTYEFELMEDAT